MKRTEIINKIIKKNGFTSYLEIGVNDAVNFNAIECESKTGVDPNVEGDNIFTQTSNEYLENSAREYDCIFIDGDHTYTQSKEDLYNCLMRLNKGGLILMHDTNPNNIKEITPKNNGKAWCGEVYKTVLEAIWDGYVVETIPDDYGLSIIRNEQIPFKEEIKQVTPQEFLKNKEKLLNFISFNNYITRESIEVEAINDLIDNVEVVRNTDHIIKEDLEVMSDEELKDFHKRIHGSKPKGKFNREKVINKILN